MDEVQEVMAAAQAQDEAGRPWALATIVSVAGSTYRRPGARLLVRDDNSWVGNLSGGCLEGEVLALGADAIDDHVLRREVYDLTADEEAIWGWGLGCNGAMEVIVEAGDASGRTHLELLDRGRRSGVPFRLVSVIGPTDADDLGRHALVLDTDAAAGADGAAAGTGDDLPDEVLAAALAQERTNVLDVTGRDVYVERVVPPQRLLVCGAGHDAIPVVARAASLGWDVVVVDDRSNFLTPERFPGAADFVHTPPGDTATATRIDERTAAVVMSHNFMRDADYLAALAPAGLAYLGMLGPGKRLRRLLDHLASEGIHIDEADLEHVHGPAGLDLGAEGPDEIAVAIVAEVMAATRGRDGGFLRGRPGPIHEPTAARPPGLPAAASS
jgi:xanthine dehydrogenase accessory factor